MIGTQTGTLILTTTRIAETKHPLQYDMNLWLLEETRDIRVSAIAKCPKFKEELWNLIKGLSPYTAMEVCSLLSVLPTPVREVEHRFERTHSIRDKEHPQDDREIQGFLANFSTTLAKWRMREFNSPENIGGTESGMNELREALITHQKDPYPNVRSPCMSSCYLGLGRIDGVFFGSGCLDYPRQCAAWGGGGILRYKADNTEVSSS